MRTKSVDDEPDHMSIESGNPRHSPTFKNYRNQGEKFSSVTSQDSQRLSTKNSISKAGAFGFNTMQS